MTTPRIPIFVMAVIGLLAVALFLAWFDSQEGEARASTGEPSTEAVSPKEPPPLHIPDPAPPLLPVVKTLTIGKGDSLGKLLRRANIPAPTAHQFITAIDRIQDASRVRPGQEIILSFAPTMSKNARGPLERLTLVLDKAAEIRVSQEEGRLVAAKVEKSVTRKAVRAASEINDSLYLSAQRAGVPATVIAELIRLFSWDVDFQREIRRGDHFDVLYETLLVEDGEHLRNGPILAAALILSGHRKVLYRHVLADGRIGYFDAEGRSIRRPLMRTPINGARLSSGFGRRNHPILGYSRMHKGIDFAAPTGTPIFAAGDGVVTYRGRKGGYGNYVRIRHVNSFSTAYAHLSKFRRDVTKGSRVRQGQVIGYVGSTGISTGPHLHYEILRDGRQVNPLRVKMPLGIPLKTDELERFKQNLAQRDKVWASLPVRQQLAAAD